MNNNNLKYWLIIPVCAIVLLLGGTYAWYVWQTSNDEETIIATDTGYAQVFFDGGSDVNGKLKPVSDKTKGMSKTITVVADKAFIEPISFNLYLDINSIDENLKHESFKFELYKDGELVKAGNFSDTYLTGALSECSKNEGVNHITLTNDVVTTTEAVYTLYTWIDGNMSNPIGMEGKDFDFALHADGQHAILGDINDLSTINLLENKTALFIGDSVQAGSKNDGKAWSYYIEQEYSMGDVNNVAVGSTSFTQNSRTPSRIIEQYQNLTSTYDYVIIEGGINDLTYGSQWGTLSDKFNIVKNSEVVVEAMEEAFYTALTKFPTAKIGYILLYNTEDSGRTNHDTQLQEYHDLIISICEKWNIPVLDMYSGSVVYEGQTLSFDELLDVHNKTYLVDGLHLNEAGYLRTYKYIAEWMKTLTTVSAPTIDEEEEPVETVKFGSSTYYIVANDIADLKWTAGYKVGTGMEYLDAKQEGRLASKGYVLRVSGGETISISDGENYNFALYEVDENHDPSGERCENWLTNSVTLNSSTKYVGFYLKKVNETDWSIDEINNIPNILTIQ